MDDSNSLRKGTNIRIKLFKVIFYICGAYFFLMGACLIFIPNLMVMRIANPDVNPTIIGMLRGAGGATIPYAVLYIMIARKPSERFWGVYTILSANIIAIILDLWSVYLQEYQWSYAMYDIPMEVLSIAGIIILWRSLKRGKE